MAEEIFLPLSFDTSGLSSELDSMQSSIKNLSKESQKFGTEGSQAARNVGKSMDKGAKSAKNATDEINKGTKAHEKHGSELVENIKNYEVFGVSINSVSQNLKAAKGAMVGMTTATTGGAKALKIFRAALISTGIGALVVALGSVVAYLSQTQKGIDLVSTVMAGLGAAVNVVIQRLVSFGSGILSLFKGDIQEGLDKMRSSFSGIGSEMRENAVLAAAIRKELDKLDKKQADLEVRRSKERADIEELKKLADDKTKSEEERVSAAEKAFGMEQRLLNAQLQAQEKRVRLLKQQNELAGNTLTEDQIQRVRDAEIELAELREDSAGKQTELQNTINSIRKEEEAIIAEQIKQQQEARAEQLEAEQKYADSLAAVQEKIEQNRIGTLSGSERVKAERDQALSEIDALETELKAQAKAAGKAYDESFVEALRGQVRREAEEELTEITRQANAERIESFFNMVETLISERKEEIKQQEELAMLKVELLEESTNELLSLEQFKEKRRLEIKKKSYYQQLQLIRFQFGEDSEEAKLLETQILILNKKIAGILDVDKSEEFQNIQDKFNSFLKDTLNLDDDQLGQFKDAISSLANDIGSLITSATDRQIEENERLLDSIRERREAVEGELEAELEAQEKGYANNVESKRKELEQIQAQEEAAEQRQAELQQKAAKRQLASDIATQGSALATTAINLIKGFSNIPLGLGIPLALSLVASIFTTFKSLKAQAAEIGSSSLSEGGAVSQHLNGRSDKRGQRGHRVEGSNLRLGGDEFVIRSEISQRERPFIEAFNKNGWKSVPMSLLPDSLGGRVVGTGVNANDMLVRDAIRKQTEDMIKHSDGKSEYIPLPDGYIERKGDKKKRVKIRP